jgi:hypothetical protein
MKTITLETPLKRGENTLVEIRNALSAPDLFQLGAAVSAFLLPKSAQAADAQDE